MKSAPQRRKERRGVKLYVLSFAVNLILSLIAKSFFKNGSEQIVHWHVIVCQDNRVSPSQVLLQMLLRHDIGDPFRTLSSSKCRVNLEQPPAFKPGSLEVHGQVGWMPRLVCLR
jgi:hypothetical protein